VPLYRYRRIEDVPPPPALPPLHPDNLPRFFDWCAAMIALRPVRLRPGLHRGDLRDRDALDESVIDRGTR
jgi:hypothetical protein